VTSVIPIVMLTSSDPVGDGLIASLRRPGGNVTGLTLFAPELGGKRLQLIAETIPRLGTVAVLQNPDNPTHVARLKELDLAARSRGIDLQTVNARQLGEYQAAFTFLRRLRPNALLTLSDATFWYDRRELTRLAAESRLPVVYPERDFVDAGGLMAYGPIIEENWRRAAVFVDRIFRGTRPADLPVEEPTKFELVINLKAAKALGLTIPPSLLLRADQVIE
jgi:putative tryptophan/tyrosine transport system substrate-binding protein